MGSNAHSTGQRTLLQRRLSTTAGVTSRKTAQVTASPRTVSPLGQQPRGREIDTSPLPPGSRQSRGHSARLRKSECPQRCAGPRLSWGWLLLYGTEMSQKWPVWFD